MNVSVLILTKNEEINLPRCLATLNWCDDIVIFDSYSTDNTVDIAKKNGARVFKREFDNYAAQREAARTEVDYKYSWVLAVDADECVEDELRQEIMDLVSKPFSELNDAYRMRRKDYFMGKWIKNSTLYPSWFVRLYQPKKVKYEERTVHEYLTNDGPVGELQEHLLHYSFNKGLQDWLIKHVRYSKLEAVENLQHIASSTIEWQDLYAKDPVKKRRALKGLSQRLPFRPLFRFFYMYFIRKGILDGYAGFTYSILLAIYEYYIVLHMEELKLRKKGEPF